MGATTLAAFRRGLYACFSRAADALFEVGDAAPTAAQPRSFVELSQAVVGEKEIRPVTNTASAPLA